MSEGDDIAACAGLVQRGDPGRFRATMAAPVALRRKLFPLYAFNLEVARAPWVTQEPLIAEMRLQWWRDALDEIASGGVARRHEVVTPLALVLDGQGARDLDSLVEARRADIERAPPADLAQIERYVDATAGTLLWTAVRLTGAASEDAVRAAGRAQGIAAYLTAVPDLKARGRQPLPPGDEVGAMAALAETGLAALAVARKDRPKGQAAPVMTVMAGIHATLTGLARAPEAGLRHPVTQSAFRNALSFAATSLTGRF